MLIVMSLRNWMPSTERTNGVNNDNITIGWERTSVTAAQPHGDQPCACMSEFRPRHARCAELLLSGMFAGAGQRAEIFDSMRSRTSLYPERLEGLRISRTFQGPRVCRISNNFEYSGRHRAVLGLVPRSARGACRIGNKVAVETQRQRSLTPC